MVDTARLPIPPRPKPEMTFIGYLMAGVLLVVLLPLLPIVLVAYVLDALTGRSPEPGGEA